MTGRSSPAPAVSPRAATLLALAAVLAVGACRARRDRCGDPVTVAQAFVESMAGSDAAAALGYLSQAARQDLERRAQEESGKLGQKLDAADLLVPERSVLPRAEWLMLRAAVGDEAWIDVRAAAEARTTGVRTWSK